MKINKAGLELIKRFEGCRLTTYLCAAGVPTIGWGHTVDVKLGQKITQHQADVMLQSDLEIYEEGVEKLLKGTPVNENQFSALVSLSYNIGLANLANSTLLKLLRRGDVAGAAGQFERWALAKGVRLEGLAKRRKAERSLFTT